MRRTGRSPSVGVLEAKTHLSALLARVEQGERIVITRNGRPIARLVRAGNRRKKPYNDVVRRIDEFRATHSLGDLSLRDLIGDGRP